MNASMYFPSPLRSFVFFCYILLDAACNDEGLQEELYSKATGCIRLCFCLSLKL